MARSLFIWIGFLIGASILLLSGSCHAWGYHHPAAIRLPTERPTTTTTHVPTTAAEPSTIAINVETITSEPPATTSDPEVQQTSTDKPSSTAQPSKTTAGATATNPATKSVTTPYSKLTSSPSSSTTQIPSISTQDETTTTTQFPRTTQGQSTTTTELTTKIAASFSTNQSASSVKFKTTTENQGTGNYASADIQASTVGTVLATISTATTTSSVPKRVQETTITTADANPAITEQVRNSSAKSTQPTASSAPPISISDEAPSTVSPGPTSSIFSSEASPASFKARREFATSLGTSSEKRNSTRDFAKKPPCVRSESEVNYWDFGYCSLNCTKDVDCNGQQNERCVCDGPCGKSCVTPEMVSTYCNAPALLENGKALLVGDLGLYDYRNQLQRFTHNQKVIFECDENYTLIDGPQEKICRSGMWYPAAGEPKCIFSETPGFRWMQAARVKRRVKAGGTAKLASKLSGGNRSGKGGKRGRKRVVVGSEEDEEEEIEIVLCPGFEDDPNIKLKLISGPENSTEGYADGAIVRVSCSAGWGVNLPNDTIVCDFGLWRPKTPECVELPCKVPYIPHGTFYVGGKALYFTEVKAHGTNIDLRCSKGYILKGSGRLHCSFGEFDLMGEPPECLPASCNLPQLDRGAYTSRFKAGMAVAHGTEIDYQCNGDLEKMAPGGPAKCHLGNWRPNKPACFHPSYFHGLKNFSHEKDNKLISTIRRSCGLPQKEKGAIFYVEGKPIDYETEFMYPDGTEVMYRCAYMKSKPKNSRYKLTCEDGQWVGAVHNLTCDVNSTGAGSLLTIKQIIRMINSSCNYMKKETNVVTFFADQQLTMNSKEFPPGTLLVNRCIDIGKFKLIGAVRRKCISGQWLGITPKCEGLSQYYDYIVDKPPTILFRYLNGSIAQTNEGKLLVYPGTTLFMECLYIRRFGRPQWNVSNSHKTYPEGWTDGIENRDPSLEYRLTVENATEIDTGMYSCMTPSRYSHQVQIVVKKIDCPQLPERSDLLYSTDSTMFGTKVSFKCRDGNALIGPKEIVCQTTGSWSGSLPKCENVECRDISMVPAMGPLAPTSMTRNGTLKKNETAPPKISILSRDVGGKAIFSCPQGYIIDGSTQAICQINGEWSTAIPLCNEVECPPPPSPQNGYVTGKAPYKAGDLAQVECRPGYMMEGQSIIACQDNGKWSRASSTTKCAKACTYPGTTIGGTISSVKFYYPIGETVEFDCTEGYDLEGARMLHCLDSAKWSTSIPTCIPGDGTPQKRKM